MVDNISNANHIAADARRRTIVTPAIGMNAFRPIMFFQVSMLRMWADSIERFAGYYQQGFEETATVVKEQKEAA